MIRYAFFKKVIKPKRRIHRNVVKEEKQRSIIQMRSDEILNLKALKEEKKIDSRGIKRWKLQDL